MWPSKDQSYATGEIKMMKLKTLLLCNQQLCGSLTTEEKLCRPFAAPPRETLCNHVSEQAMI